MNCLEFHRHCGEDPRQQGASYLRHQAECAACAAYAEQMAGFDDLLLQAMRVEAPEDLSLAAGAGSADLDREPAPRPGFRQQARLRIFALAASLLAAVGLSIALWPDAGPSLGEEVIAHLFHEPRALVPTDFLVDDAAISRVMARSGARFVDEIGSVTYVKLCPFRGREVAHLVVQGEYGPVTILLLPDEQVRAPTSIDEEGFRGTILPLGRGSIAVVGTAEEPLEPVRNRVVKAVEWSI